VSPTLRSGGRLFGLAVPPDHLGARDPDQRHELVAVVPQQRNRVDVEHLGQAGVLDDPFVVAQELQDGLSALSSDAA
jgi:hypothetical protein